MAIAPLENWIDDRQSRGSYTFLRSEAVEESGLSGEAVKKALQRMTRRGRIAKAKDYLFVIVPLEDEAPSVQLVPPFPDGHLYLAACLRWRVTCAPSVSREAWKPRHRDCGLGPRVPRKSVR